MIVRDIKSKNGLCSRGLDDEFITVVDELKGFPEAITTVFP